MLNAVLRHRIRKSRQSRVISLRLLRRRLRERRRRNHRARYLLRFTSEIVLDEFVRDEPLTALAIAVTAGFILGGGAETRIGRAALTLVGRSRFVGWSVTCWLEC
jgi:ElaB/YqjD/DUF883 family membrane-anchored ribosome-binding protein